MKNKPTETYEKNGVSVAEIEFKGNFGACYFLTEGVEGIILNSRLPKRAKPQIVDFLLEKSRTKTLEPIDFLNTEDTPNVKGLIYTKA